MLVKIVCKHCLMPFPRSYTTAKCLKDIFSCMLLFLFSLDENGSESKIVINKKQQYNNNSSGKTDTVRKLQ